MLSKEPLLRYYDSKKPVTIQADASSTGLEACLMQEGQPISYASRALTETEQQYAQIEKELLAIVFMAEKFNHYIYGAETEVESDHCPLEAIFKKSLHKTSPRLQQMLHRLLKYKLTVKYIPGSRMYIADTLSRAYITEENRGNSPVNDVRIHSVIADFPAWKERLYKIRVNTQEDEDLQNIKQYVRKGWPKRKQDLKPAIQPYWSIHGEIYIEDEMLFRGEKLVIPELSREEILDKLHEGHLGQEKCKARARQML